MELTLLGAGAMRSPRYAPAGLLLAHRGTRIAFDGGPGAVPTGRLDAWLVTDDRSELRAAVRRLAHARGCEPRIDRVATAQVAVEPIPVAHTSHPTFGFLITSGGRHVAWAPEFWEFPSWVAGVDLLFAEAAGWSRPIRFAGGVGGHAAALDVARAARAAGVRRLVLAHIGRPTIRALDQGRGLPFGEPGEDGRRYRV
jgi:Beta-lactamase superfamily domain